MNIEDNPVFQAIRQRRSIRKYTGELVPREAVKAILEAGRWAPSGLNNQPCRFLVLKSSDPRKEGLAACTRYAKIVTDCDVGIAVLLDREKMYNEMKDYQSAGACIQNMLLATHTLGFGAVWLGEIVNQSSQVLDVLGLDPQRFRFMALLALGVPATQGHSTRMELEHFLLEEF